uniref:DUF4175 family protein n=1 Tax=candidate division WOR-3 bacterium TaxID=2052148 RepID=A0A7C4CCU0_UNCW3
MSESPGLRLRARLRAVARRRLVNDLAAVLLAGAAGAGLMVLVAAVAFWSGWLVLLGTLPAVFLGWRWLRSAGITGTARLVEKRFAELRGRLVVALELAGYKSGPEGYSLELRDAAVGAVEAEVTGLELERVVESRRPLFAGTAAVIAAGLLVGFALLFPTRAGVGLANAFMTDRLDVRLMVEPGDTVVASGASVVLRCRVEPSGVFGAVVFEHSREAGIGAKRLRLQGDSCRLIVGAGTGFAYWFRVLGRRSGEHRVRVMAPLLVERLTCTLEPPKYTGLPATKTSGLEIVALRGTRVQVEAAFNRPVSSVRLCVGPETVAMLAADRGGFAAAFVVRGDAAARVVAAESGEAGQVAATLQVRAVPDEPPFVKLFAPGRDVDLPVSMQVALGINSLDDYGLTGIWLHYGKESVNQRVRLKALAGRREDTTVYVWDLANSGLLPGEEMRYYVSASDNDAVSGPKPGRSETFVVRFPTIHEIFNAAVNRTEQTAAELAPLQSKQGRIAEELARVGEELKRNRELSWDERRALEQVLGEQAGLMEQVENLKQQIANTMAEMAQGMMLDEETMKRLGELQEVLARLIPDELQQALARLHQELAQQSPDLSRSLERVELEQQQLKAGIDRALEFLRRILEEQRLEALARKTEELAASQQRLTDELETATAAELGERQQAVNTALDSVLQEMASLARTADSAGWREWQGIPESLQALGEQARKDRLLEAGQALQSQLQQGSRTGLEQQSRKLAGQMTEMARSLQELSSRLGQQRTGEIARKLAAGARDLLMVSEEEERLEARAAVATDLTPLARQQMGLHEATRIVAESLAAAAAQTLAVPPGLGRTLAEAMGRMVAAGQAMVDNNVTLTRAAMADARRALNRAAADLLSALAGPEQGGSFSGGMEGLLEQLARLASGQMQLNAAMGGIPIPIPMPGGLTAQQMSQLARLLSQQQALRQQLEQLLSSMGGERPGLTSSMEGVLEEMKAVERSLAELDIDRQLVERQEGILSRLLDAQRSLRQQGHKEERESETGKAFVPSRPASLPADRGERNRVLREELMRALKQGYSREEEMLIRDYFERLMTRP